jgi:hypothetical protein
LNQTDGSVSSSFLMTVPTIRANPTRCWTRDAWPPKRRLCHQAVGFCRRQGGRSRTSGGAQAPVQRGHEGRQDNLGTGATREGPHRRPRHLRCNWICADRRKLSRKCSSFVQPGRQRGGHDRMRGRATPHSPPSPPTDVGEFPLNVVRIDCSRCDRAGSIGVTAWWRGSGRTSPCPIRSWPWRHANVERTSLAPAARGSRTWPPRL